jgi:hypothetical protein
MACTQSRIWERSPLTPAEAIERARRVANERGWSWVGAVRVSASLLAAMFGPRAYEVLSNAGRRGCNVRVVVDVDSGEILDAVYFER